MTFKIPYRREVNRLFTVFVVTFHGFGYQFFIYLCLNAAKRNERKDKWFLEFPSTGAFVGSVF